MSNEPVGLDVANGKRPDGTTVLPFARGREMAWDATICHTCAPTYIPAAAATPRAAAETDDGKNQLKYTSIADRVDFPAVGLETLGAFGPSARALLDEIAMKIRERSAFAGAKARLSAAVHIGNAACILEAHSRRL